MSKTILITGATSGIGRHAALHLAKRGHRVFATGRNGAQLALLADEAKGHALETLELDVTSARSIAAAKAEVDRRTDGRGVDVLINNAGYGLWAPMELVTDDDLRKQFDTNVFGLMAVTRAFVPAMRDRGDGRVLNVSSVGGRITLPFGGAYNATKYALESMSDALRLELAPFGVRVVLIEPGLIRTEFAARTMGLLAKYREEPSAYTGVLDKARDMEKQLDGLNVGPEHISRAITRAVEARRPSARYVAPWRTYAALWFMKAMPTSFVDWVLRRASGLTRQNLLASPKVAPVSDRPPAGAAEQPHAAA